MTVTGIKNNFSIEEFDDRDNIRAVDGLLGTTQSSAFFMDRNPDRTQTPDFNRRLQDEQRKLQLAEYKHEKLKESADLKELYRQMANGNIGRFVDTRR